MCTCFLSRFFQRVPELWDVQRDSVINIQSECGKKYRTKKVLEQQTGMVRKYTMEQEIFQVQRKLKGAPLAKVCLLVATGQSTHGTLSMLQPPPTLNMP